MLDIKKNVVLLSLMLLPLVTQAQVGCIDADYSKVENARVVRTKDTLTIRISIKPHTEIDVETLHEGSVLQIRMYGTYIMQDHIQVSKRVSLLEYAGFTQINVVGGREMLDFKKIDSSTFILHIKI